MDMDIPLFPDPWVKGTRAEKYCGTVQAWAFVADDDARPDRLDAGLKRAVASLERKARRLGGNSVISLEIRAYPWSKLGLRKGCRIQAAGTAAQLVDL